MNLQDKLPLVSIGMPVFNGEFYLETALQSLLCQTHKNFELIISDNCSTDSTFEICQRAIPKDKRIRVFRQSRNMGPLWNFEFVLRQAQGKYFMWATHDDIWDLDWLSSAVAGFDDGIAMVTPEIIGISDMGKQISPPLKFEFKGLRTFRLAKYFLMHEAHGKANIIYSMLRTDIAKKYQFPGIKGFYGFDMHFVFFVLGKGSCVLVNGRAMYKRVPEVQYRPDQIDNWAKVSEFIFCNFRYLYAYLRIAEGDVDRLIIMFLMPLKWLAIFWCAGKSVIGRYFKLASGSRREF